MNNQSAYSLSLHAAVAAAVAEADLMNDSPRCVSAELSDGLWQLEIRTLFMRYDFFVDEATCEVLGMNAEPSTDTDEAYEIISLVPNLAA